MIQALIVLGVVVLGSTISLALFFWLAFLIIAHEDSRGEK